MTSICIESLLLLASPATLDIRRYYTTLPVSLNKQSDNEDLYLPDHKTTEQVLL